MAFERVYGPIDSSWQDQQFAEINVLLQQLILSWSDGKSDAKVTPVVMPHGLHAEYKKRKERGEID